jgi:hypothetical protein
VEIKRHHYRQQGATGESPHGQTCNASQARLALAQWPRGILVHGPPVFFSCGVKVAYQLMHAIRVRVQLRPDQLHCF